MSEAEAIVAEHVHAFNAGDAARLLAGFTDDATWVTGDYAVPPGELRDFFETAMRSLTPQLQVTRVIDGGNAVVAELTESWTHGDVPKTAALIAVFDLSETKIRRAKIYREGSADA